jgi:peptide/nickel transport system substrate-binding protein
MNQTGKIKSLLITISLALLLSCGGGGGTREDASVEAGSTDSSGPVRGGRLVIGVQQEPEMLSEILNAMATNNLVCNLIFSKFVKYDDSLRLIPDIIEAIPNIENGGISQDHLRYTYRLRKDAYWHDGQPVTSGDVKFTYEIIMNPKVNVESREGWDSVKMVETPDDHTVVFHLKRPYPDFVGETFYEESVLPKHLLENETGEKFHSSNFHHQPVGSGPFKFKQWMNGSHLIVERNDAYYGEGPYLDEIIFKFIPDENSLLVQIKTGEIDLFHRADINYFNDLKNLPGIKVYQTPMMMYEHIDFNTEHPILKDRRVRRAISYATNKKQIAERVYNGLVEVANLDEFPSSKYFNPEAEAKARFNPLEARRLLRDAGWSDTDGDGILEKNGQDLSLVITATSGQVNRKRTQLVLREQYRDVGIDLSIRNYNSTLLYGTYQDGGILKRGKFDIVMYAWLSSPEPATKEALYSYKNIPPNGQNNPRFHHEGISQLLQQGSNELDEAKRIKIYHEISNILVDESPVIPLFWYTSLNPCTTRLKNFKPNPTQSADTWNAATWYLSQ